MRRAWSYRLSNEASRSCLLSEFVIRCETDAPFTLAPLALISSGASRLDHLRLVHPVDASRDRVRERDLIGRLVDRHAAAFDRRLKLRTRNCRARRPLLLELLQPPTSFLQLVVSSAAVSCPRFAFTSSLLTNCSRGALTVTE